MDGRSIPKQKNIGPPSDPPTEKGIKKGLQNCVLQRMVTMGGLKSLTILTEPQRKMAMTAIKPCQYPVVFHHYLSISEIGL